MSDWRKWDSEEEIPQIFFTDINFLKKKTEDHKLFILYHQFLLEVTMVPCADFSDFTME